jgi:hypothetical protein
LSRSQINEQLQAITQGRKLRTKKNWKNHLFEVQFKKKGENCCVSDANFKHQPKIGYFFFVSTNFCKR